MSVRLSQPDVSERGPPAFFWDRLFARAAAPTALLGRLLLAYIFVVEGWGKIAMYSGSQDYMQQFGVPGSLLPLVILTELGGGLMVACGLLTRLAALALAGFCLLTALLFHTNFNDFNEVIHFEKDLGLAGGFLVLVAFGPGAWSIDAWMTRSLTRR
jgi:putative oxidoreductase